MLLAYRLHNIRWGALIYSLGDSIAALLLGQFQWTRLLGMVCVGATFYAWEIPNYFRWIERKVGKKRGVRPALQKTGLAMLYFNPLWIARHFLFIKLSSGHWEEVTWDLVGVALLSFLANIPLSLLGNYLIQNVVQLKWRFFASAVFSALMAIYYAGSMVYFKYGWHIWG